jgi:hypothetical protein
MKRLLIALGFMSALMSPAYAQKTKAAITTEINTNFADNNTGAITPALLRSTTLDLVNSYVDYNGAGTFTCSANSFVSSGTTSLFACTQPSFSSLSGILGLSQGGTNANLTASNGGIVYSTASSFAILPGTSTANLCLLSGSSSAPSWGSCPGGGGGSGVVNPGTSGQLTYYAASTNTVSSLGSASISSSPTLTGNWIFSPATGDALVASPVGGTTAKGLNVTQTGPSSSSTAGIVNYNAISVTDNYGSTVMGNPTNALSVALNFGGSNTQGNHTAFESISSLTAPASVTSNDRDYVGGTLVFRSSSSDNGTNTGAGSKGNGFGANIACQLFSGATNYNGCVGAEIDVAIGTGASSASRFGLTYVASGVLQAATSTKDSAIEIGSTDIGQSWANGIIVGGNHGAFGLATNGSVLSIDPGGGTPTIANGIDLVGTGGMTISGNAWKSPGAQIDGTGSLTISSNTTSSLFTSTLAAPLTIRTTGGGSTSAVLDNGTASRATTWAYADNGTIKWFAGKQTDNSFIVFDATNSHSVFSAPSGLDIVTIAGSGHSVTPFLNITSPATGLQFGGFTVMKNDGTYTYINDPSGGQKFFFGNISDPSSYFRNTNFLFQKDASISYMVLTSGGLFLGNGINNTVTLMTSLAPPLINTGFCTGATIPHANGTAAFEINVGSSACGSTGTLSIANATNGWVCSFHNVTNPATNVVEQTGGAVNTITLTNYVRTTGVAGNFTASDVIRANCTAY